MLELDHLAVSGATLQAAVAHLEEVPEVATLPGGRHDVFATHNRLSGLADGLYLEAIATDPEAPPPGRARRFGLDRFAGRARLSNRICRVVDMVAALARWPEAGAPVALRRGDLRWRMAVPQSGLLPFDGLFPALIAWQVPVPPGDSLPGSGCALTRLVVVHPEAGALCARLGLGDGRIRFEAGPAALRAEVATPSGARVLA